MSLAQQESEYFLEQLAGIEEGTTKPVPMLTEAVNQGALKPGYLAAVNHDSGSKVDLRKYQFEEPFVNIYASTVVTVLVTHIA